MARNYIRIGLVAMVTNTYNPHMFPAEIQNWVSHGVRISGFYLNRRTDWSEQSGGIFFPESTALWEMDNLFKASLIYVWRNMTETEFDMDGDLYWVTLADIDYTGGFEMGLSRDQFISLAEMTLPLRGWRS